MRGKVIIIQGGQYGSEGKGQIAAYVAGQKNVKVAVRTGSINAGHTVYKDDKKFSMQIVPTAWIHKDKILVLGAGCYIEPDILAREVAMIREATGEDIRHRLLIDWNCFAFGSEELERAKHANRHHAMGATGKGASEAIISKMQMRGSDSARSRLFHNQQSWADGYVFMDTSRYLNLTLDEGHDVLLEGTQGALLDFNLGPYPFVTSRMTNAAAWLAEAGLPPTNVHTILVLRSHPIRVAGNSGPLPNETNWIMLAQTANKLLDQRGHPPVVKREALEAFRSALRTVLVSQYPDLYEAMGTRALFPESFSTEERQKWRVYLSEANAQALGLLPVEVINELKFFERTTVTKKLRRVATFDLDDARRAIMWNAPAEIAYTFLNYDMPELYGESNLMVVQHVAGDHLREMEKALGVPIRYVTTERMQHHVIDLNS